MVKSRRKASSSGVPKVLSWRISRSAAALLRGLGWLDLGAGRDAAAERRHLDRLVAETDVGEPEAPADDPAVPEQLLDLVRVGVGTDVEVFRLPAEQQVPHAATDEVSGVVELLQPVQNFERVRVDVPARNRVLRPRDDHRLSHPGRHCSACYDRRMLPREALLVGVPAPLRFPPAAQAQRADLATARALYNQRQFDAAIEAAIAARARPATADSAAILQARAHLERYRERPILPI